MLIKVLAPGYYSRQDTRTPVRYGIIAMVSNMVFNLILAFPFGYVGLAMATSMSALLNAGLLYRGLHKAGVYRVSRQTGLFFIKALLSCAVMVGLLLYFLPPQEVWLGQVFHERASTLLMLIAAGGASYLITLVIFGVRPWKIKTGL